MKECTVVNILDMFENFVWHNAIEIAKKKMSITYFLIVPAFLLLIGGYVIVGGVKRDIFRGQPAAVPPEVINGTQ